MLTRIDLRDRVPSPAELRAILPRAEVDVDAVLHQVRPMINAVRERGVDAALQYTERFDRVRPETVRVPALRLTHALRELDPAVREALEESISRA
ncbi:histidinol dehydrogenase, partial [Actinophytocola sp.]|uniref:histidinol dehydrogenase n=1 Tax=Actinophytocola sp. TaxID=1872138 RepID=UPI002D7E4C36